MNSLKVYPFAKYFISLVGGIILGIIIETKLIKTICFFYLCSLILYVALIASYKSFHLDKNKLKSRLSITIYINIIFAGYIIFCNAIPDNSKKILNVESIGVFELNNPIEKKTTEKKHIFVAKLAKIQINNVWVVLPEKTSIIVFLNKKIDKIFLPNSRIIVSGKLQNFKNNPSNTKFSLAQKYKISNLFLAINDPSQIENIKLNENSFFMKVSNYFLNTINQNIQSNEAKGIISCLLLGKRDKLDLQIKNAYITTGVMHLLAISGLHIGILYYSINLLLSFFIKNRKYSVIKSFIGLILLWCYAILCGLSSSILRATTMFSFMEIGKILSRKNNIYNSLAVSAFFILVFKPLNIIDIGFQLSYLGVISIAYFSDKIYRLINIKSLITKRIWKSLSVSLAAQILTLPISVFYFESLPIYATINNLFLVPYTSVLLYISVFLLCVAQCKLVANFTGLLLGKFVALQNKFILTMAQIPLSSIQNIKISFIETLLIYALITDFCLFMEYKKYLYFLGFVAICLIEFLLVFS